ncbi:MAG TPA: hypothetical protein VH592_03760 [Gemmataceae bacterium]|jgi:hypothetical protein
MSEQAYNDDRRDAALTELAAFQNALAHLSPSPEGVNISRLLFRAGQLSAPRPSRAWPSITAASLMLAVALGSMFLFRPAPEPTERIVTVYVPAPPLPMPQAELSPSSTGETPMPDTTPVTGGGDSDYLRLRREVLAHGLDALPPPTMWSAALPNADTDNLLDLPRGSREPWLLRLKRSLQSGGPS